MFKINDAGTAPNSAICENLIIWQFWGANKVGRQLFIALMLNVVSMWHEPYYNIHYKYRHINDS